MPLQSPLACSQGPVGRRGACTGRDRRGRPPLTAAVTPRSPEEPAQRTHPPSAAAPSLSKHPVPSPPPASTQQSLLCAQAPPLMGGACLARAGAGRKANGTVRARGTVWASAPTLSQLAGMGPAVTQGPARFTSAVVAVKPCPLRPPPSDGRGYTVTKRTRVKPARRGRPRPPRLLAPHYPSAPCHRPGPPHRNRDGRLLVRMRLVNVQPSTAPAQGGAQLDSPGAVQSLHERRARAGWRGRGARGPAPRNTRGRRGPRGAGLGLASAHRGIPPPSSFGKS